MKRLYAEVGLGNPTFLSTEIESEGHERRVPGLIVGPRDRQLYARIWVCRLHLALDEKGFSVSKRDRRKIKIVIGLASSPEIDR